MASEPDFLTGRSRRRADVGPAVLLVGVVVLVLSMLPGSYLEDEARALAAKLPPVSAMPSALLGAPSPRATPEQQPALEEPRRVRIPRIGLREDLVHLGLTGDGRLEVPEDPDRVGWFSASGMPSRGLPLVLAGHVDSQSGPAVFARLSELEVGDRVVVVTDSGRQRYVVTRIRSVPQDAFPTRHVFGATRVDTLKLITCTGPYDRTAGRYTRNLVVTAHRA